MSPAVRVLICDDQELVRAGLDMLQDRSHLLAAAHPVEGRRRLADRLRTAREIGLGLMETAAGIAKIAEFKMADIIRKTTVEKGLDPRDFTVFAFGGAGPLTRGRGRGRRSIRRRRSGRPTAEPARGSWCGARPRSAAA